MLTSDFLKLLVLSPNFQGETNAPFSPLRQTRSQVLRFGEGRFFIIIIICFNKNLKGITKHEGRKNMVRNSPEWPVLEKFF